MGILTCSGLEHLDQSSGLHDGASVAHNVFMLYSLQQNDNFYPKFFLPFDSRR
jgi:hypothetical protein